MYNKSYEINNEPNVIMSRDGNGEAVVTIGPATFEPDFRGQHFSQRKDFVNYQLRENFPRLYVFIHAALLILIGIASIALQVILIQYKSPFYYIGYGIWGGILCLIIGAISILLGNY